MPMVRCERRPTTTSLRRTSERSSPRFGRPSRRRVAAGTGRGTSGKRSSRASERNQSGTSGSRARAVGQGGTVTDRLEDVVLTRPTTGRPGPLDERLYDLVEARFRRIVRDNPIVGTYVGIHTEDDRLGDASRDQVL